VLDEGGVGHASYDAVAADIVEAIAADDELRVGGPTGRTVLAPVGPRFDGPAIHPADRASLDENVVEGGADLPSDDVEKDAGIALAAVAPVGVMAVDVANLDTAKMNVTERAGIFAEDANAGAGRGPLRPVVGDLKIADLPVVLIV